ncbi:MAG: hypothetical protein JXR07_13590 [Reichenbachiella sp.]
MNNNSKYKSQPSVQLILLSMLICSCEIIDGMMDHEFERVYRITNDSDKDVIVMFEARHKSDTVLIASKNRKRIYKEIIPGNIEFVNVDFIFNSIIVMNSDSLLSTDQYLDHSIWKYTNDNNGSVHHRYYDAYIDNEEF